jgi:hypothetical protein
MFRWQTQGDPELFLKYNYPETKDLCKQFLTLVVAVLVFSLTLSEKIIQFQQASFFAKLLLGVAWSSMLISPSARKLITSVAPAIVLNTVGGSQSEFCF